MQNLNLYFNRKARRKEADDLILFWWFLLMLMEEQRQIDERMEKLIESIVNPPNRPPTLG